MNQQTKIEWTDFTVNFWEGCQKVGPGCDNCYAEARDKRFTGGEHWGPGAPRRKVKGGIAKLQKINRDAEAFKAVHGHWPRVFCSSLSDVFDNAVDAAWRSEGFAAIEAAANTRIQLLTKRIGNVEGMIPFGWGTRDPWPQHVGLMITAVNQAEANRDIPKLLDLKARLGIPWVGLSIEPMLGFVSLRVPFAGAKLNALHGAMPAMGKLDWVICGGESGPSARPMHPDWARNLRDQCVAAGAPFFFKQWGEWTDGQNAGPNKRTIPAANWFDNDWFFFASPPSRHDDHIDNEFDLFRVGKQKAGRKLDGREWNEVPAQLVRNQGGPDA